MVDEGQQKQQLQGRPDEEVEQVDQSKVNGFYIHYAAVAIMVPLLLAMTGFAITDHSAINRLEDRLEFLNSRVIDGTVVARLVDHDANLVERMKVVDDRIKSLETFAGSSTQDRAAIHYELSSLRDYLRYQGKSPPEPPHGPINQDSHP